MHDQLVFVERGRRGHHPVRRVAAPDDLAVTHRDRGHGAVEVRDERDLVVDDRRELDQRAHGPAPDQLERRPDVDVGLRLRARLDGAVHRPLQLRLEDPHGVHRPVREPEALLVLVVAAAVDGDGQAPAMRDLDPGDAVTVGAAGMACDLDEGSADTCAEVTVLDDHVHEGRLGERRRPERHRLRGGRGGRVLGVLRAAAGGEQRQGESYDPESAHFKRLESDPAGGSR